MGNKIINLDGSVNMLYPCLSVIGAQTLCYTFCQFKKDNSYIDIAWSLTFLMPNAVIIGSMLSLGMPIDARTWALNACLAVWAVRLAWHIGARHTEEDYRYVSLRERMSKCGPFMYYVLSFFLIFMLQAGLSLCVNWTVIRTTAMSSAATFGVNGGKQAFQWSDYLGFSMFTIGFLFEAVGDSQLKDHIANEDPNKGKFVKHGLWKYTRHPNYFGEALLWWGLFVVSLGVNKGYVTVFSPLVMHFLLRYVSGVPLLERKARKHPEWAQYEA